jgi:DNA-binding MarR family transcriptional regulator
LLSEEGIDNPKAATATAEPDLADVLLDTSKILVAIAVRSLAEVDENLTMRQFRALATLSSGAACGPSSLSCALGVRASTVTRLCSQLTRKGLICKLVSEVDGRRVILRLTPRGEALIDEVWERRKLAIAGHISGINSPERGALLLALSRFNSGGTPELHAGAILEGSNQGVRRKRLWLV